MARQRGTRHLARWFGATGVAIQLTHGLAGVPNGLCGPSSARADDAGTATELRTRTRSSLRDAGVTFEPDAGSARMDAGAPGASPPDDDAALAPDDDTETAPAASSYDVEACYAELSRAGVAYERVPSDVAPRVPGPLWLRSALGGIVVESTTSSRIHDVIACPLALALLSVSDVLRDERVTRIETYSVFRPGSGVARPPRRRGRHRRRGGGQSRHARAMAIDIGAFVRDGAPPLRVLEHWGPHPRRRLRCTAATMTAPRRGRRRVRGVTAQSAALHRIHCGVAARRVFTVVLSPHYNRAHHNHLHWDVDPAVRWRSIY